MDMMYSFLYEIAMITATLISSCHFKLNRNKIIKNILWTKHNTLIYKKQHKNVNKYHLFWGEQNITPNKQDPTKCSSNKHFPFILFL